LATRLLFSDSGRVAQAVQEVAFQKHGAHVQEAIFWKSVLGLPFFAMRWEQVGTHARRWSEEPVMWLLVLLEVVADYVTARSVTHLVASTSSLTASVVLTLQRFLSLVFSAAGLNARLLGVSSPPPPPNSLWFGSGLVLAGAILYILNPRAASVAAPAQAEHQKTGPQMSEPTGRLRRVNSAGSRL